MDPVTALGVAGTIVQLVDFSTKLLKRAWEVHSSGSSLTAEEADLELLTKDLEKATQLWNSKRSATAASKILDDGEDEENEDERALQELSDRCRAISKEVSSLLGKHRSSDPNSRSQSLKVAWSGLRSRKDIDILQKRINMLRDQMLFRINVMMSKEQSALAKKLDNLIQQANTYGLEAGPLMADQKRSIITTCQNILKSSGRSKDDGCGVIALNLLQLVKAQQQAAPTLRILEMLKFDTIDARIRRIERAHAKTFDWLFDEDMIGVESNIPNTFKPWLSTGKGIYYVSGKAGSGKSTLMKYICLNPRTKVELARWAGEKRLVLAQFYFWNAGTELQKSLEGLLRSLLFEILRQCADLVIVAFPNMHDEDLAIRDYQDVIQAFERLVANSGTADKYRFCFFIDGLDEYDGDLLQVVRLLKAWATSPEIKLCISSRPWNIFEDSFSRSQKLALHDLTQRDIERYVRDRFEDDENFQRLRITDSAYERLIYRTVEKAEGVFLWVYLVTRSLLNGLVNDDRVSDLERRLEIMPTGLVPVFRHMLDGVDIAYRYLTARIFTIAQLTIEPQPALIYSFLDDLEDDPQFAIKAPAKEMSGREVDERIQRTRRRLDGRCKGLLEVRAPLMTSEPELSCRVEFLHRTVHEFIGLDDVQRELADQARDFDAERSLAHSCLALFKLVPIRNGYFTSQGSFYNLIDDVMHWTRQQELHGQGPQVEVLLDLKAAFEKLLKRPFLNARGSYPLRDWCNPPCMQFSFTAFAAVTGHFDFVAPRVDADTANFALDAVLKTWYHTRYSDDRNNELIAFLRDLTGRPEVHESSHELEKPRWSFERFIITMFGRDKD